MFVKKIKTGLAVCAASLAFVTPVSQAAPGDIWAATFQGVTFTFTQTDADSLTFGLAGTPSGDWLGVQYFGAFDLKDLGLNFGTATAIANGPGATNLAGINSQLSAASVDCQAAGSPPGSICFDVQPDQQLAPLPFNLSYTIDFSAPLAVASTGIHLQVVFTNALNGPKVGSLYSQDIGLCQNGGCPGEEVPEPGSLALLGAGLAGLALIRRRRRV